MYRVINLTVVVLPGTLLLESLNVFHLPGKWQDEQKAVPSALRYVMRLAGLHYHLDRAPLQPLSLIEDNHGQLINGNLEINLPNNRLCNWRTEEERDSADWWH